MSRATTNTSGAVFSSGEENAPAPQAQEQALKIAIIGDFSGRESRGLCDPSTIGQRPALRVNKDNFEQLFERMQVRVQLPLTAEPLDLMEYDDLHPDYLYSRVPMFEQFIDLEKQLLNPSSFDAAAAEIQGWADYKCDTNESNSGASTGAQSMLDAILDSRSFQQQYEDSPNGQIDKLIKDIVAPYIAAKQDPRQDQLLEAVNSASSETMRKIMHNSGFQQIEASWRSLHMLIRRLESHSQLQIHIIDVSKDELLADLRSADDDLEQAQIFKRLVSSQTSSGDQPFNLVVGDFNVEDFEQDISLLIDMGTIAEAVGSCFISGADTRLASCPSLAGSVDPDDWHYRLDTDFSKGWEALRDYSASAHIALAAPRFLLRLPYGANTSTTDCFDFEELSAEAGHKYYLWGNSAYLLTLLLCDSYLDSGMQLRPGQIQDVDGMPVHVYQQSGEKRIKPCAEAMVTDSGAKRFKDSGLNLVRSVQGQDRVLLPEFISLHTSGELKGPWS